MVGKYQQKKKRRKKQVWETAGGHGRRSSWMPYIGPRRGSTDIPILAL